MANVFDVISGRLAPSPSKRFCADGDKTPKKGDDHYGVSSRRSLGDKVLDCGGKRSASHRGARPKVARTMWSKSAQIGAGNSPQRVHSTFIIPKKKLENKGLMIDLPLTSREWYQETLSILTQNYRHPTSDTVFSYSAAKTVHNPTLQEKYLEKRRELRLEGYSEKEVADSYGFLYLSSTQEVEKVCQDGLSVGNCPVTCVGHPNMGVQLCRYSDVLSQQSLQIGQHGYIVIFKVIKGKVKSVVENLGSVYLEPTPNFDCHIVKSTAQGVLASPTRDFHQTQLYIYEYGDLEVESQPRQICPVFVVSFTLAKSQTHQRQSKTPSCTQNAFQVPAAPALHRSSSYPAYQPSGVKPCPVNPPGSSVFSLGISSQTTLGVNKCRRLLSSSKSSAALSTSALNSSDIGGRVWSGNLCVKGDFPCPVELFSLASNIKPAVIGGNINITMKMKTDAARVRFLDQVKTLRRTADLLKNRHYYSVCHLQPKGGQSASRFSCLASYLREKDSVAVVRLKDNTDLLLFPEGKVVQELGLSVKADDPNGHLCCVFVSQKPRRLILQEVNTSRGVHQKQTTDGICKAPLCDSNVKHTVSHSVSWALTDGDTPSLDKTDYCANFPTLCPDKDLVQPASLRNLFVEQIVIQRQHNYVSEALHVPSKLYANSSVLGGTVGESPTNPPNTSDQVTVSKSNPQTDHKPSCGLVKGEKSVPKLHVNTSGSAPVVASPTIISPDTTFHESDSKTLANSKPTFTNISTKLVETTGENVVTSTVHDKCIRQANISEELAEKIVRGFRQCATNAFKDLYVNPRDPRKRKLLESVAAVTVPCKKQFSAESTRQYEEFLQEAKLVPEVGVSSTTVGQLELDCLELGAEEECGTFSPEPDEVFPDEQVESLLDSALEDSKKAEKQPTKTTSASVEPEEVCTAQDMKTLLNCGLETSFSLKEPLDPPEDEDSELLSVDEISNYLDRKLMGASCNVSHCQSAQAGRSELFHDSKSELKMPKLTVTIKNNIPFDLRNKDKGDQLSLNLKSAAESVDKKAKYMDSKRDTLLTEKENISVSSQFSKLNPEEQNISEQQISEKKASKGKNLLLPKPLLLSTSVGNTLKSPLKPESDVHRSNVEATKSCAYTDAVSSTMPISKPLTADLISKDIKMDVVSAESQQYQNPLSTGKSVFTLEEKLEAKHKLSQPKVYQDETFPKSAVIGKGPSPVQLLHHLDMASRNSRQKTGSNVPEMIPASHFVDVIHSRGHRTDSIKNNQRTVIVERDPHELIDFERMASSSTCDKTPYLDSITYHKKRWHVDKCSEGTFPPKSQVTNQAVNQYSEENPVSFTRLKEKYEKSHSERLVDNCSNVKTETQHRSRWDKVLKQPSADRTCMQTARSNEFSNGKTKDHGDVSRLCVGSHQKNPQVLGFKSARDKLSMTRETKFATLCEYYKHTAICSAGSLKGEPGELRSRLEHERASRVDQGMCKNIKLAEKSDAAVSDCWPLNSSITAPLKLIEENSETLVQPDYRNQPDLSSSESKVKCKEERGPKLMPTFHRQQKQTSSSPKKKPETDTLGSIFPNSMFQRTQSQDNDPKSVAVEQNRTLSKCTAQCSIATYSDKSESKSLSMVDDISVNCQSIKSLPKNFMSEGDCSAKEKQFPFRRFKNTFHISATNGLNGGSDMKEEESYQSDNDLFEDSKGFPQILHEKVSAVVDKSLSPPETPLPFLKKPKIKICLKPLTVELIKKASGVGTDCKSSLLDTDKDPPDEDDPFCLKELCEEDPVKNQIVLESELYDPFALDYGSPVSSPKAHDHSAASCENAESIIKKDEEKEGKCQSNEQDFLHKGVSEPGDCVNTGSGLYDPFNLDDSLSPPPKSSNEKSSSTTGHAYSCPSTVKLLNIAGELKSSAISHKRDEATKFQSSGNFTAALMSSEFTKTISEKPSGICDEPKSIHKQVVTPNNRPMDKLRTCATKKLDNLNSVSAMKSLSNSMEKSRWDNAAKPIQAASFSGFVPHQIKHMSLRDKQEHQKPGNVASVKPLSLIHSEATTTTTRNCLPVQCNLKCNDKIEPITRPNFHTAQVDIPTSPDPTNWVKTNTLSQLVNGRYMHGGILVPEDDSLLTTSPGDLERLVKRVQDLGVRGFAWSIKVHSQQICKLAAKRRVFKPHAEPYRNADGTLKVLTSAVKSGVVELLQQHACDLSATFDCCQHVACARQLHNSYCKGFQRTVLLACHGESSLQRLGEEAGFEVLTFQELMHRFI